MESDLTCAICQDLLHHPVALQPCLHAFCAGCYSKWMARHAHCPHCRAAVRLVSRHHALHSLVAAFLALHPHKRRPAAELAALDAADAIGSQPLRVRKRAAPHAAAPDADADADADAACAACGGAAPHAALRRLAERRPDALPRAALGNAFERQVLSDLIASKGITCAQFLQECLVRLETGEFHLPPPLSADSAICDECTDAAVCSLSYQFRAAVPPQELPPHVAARSDCWYGHECRTQRHNAPHAARLNHICAPTPRGGGGSLRRVGA